MTYDEWKSTNPRDAEPEEYEWIPCPCCDDEGCEECEDD